MKLSVIIVSYNVRYFLEKCLVAVFKAMDGIDGEVIVVDNASRDGSAEMVSTRFPNVHLIINAENTGFAKACNQGFRLCSGIYGLLLNPDTVVSERTFSECITFMDAHADASACGVRMVDGTGSFLPESMRGLPSPLSAFFKMTGISAMFPKSAFFNAYYMGGRNPGEIQRIPVLTGAFLFARMEIIREVGMLDEDYFMYGEDIDLCYKMTQAGYQNYYLPEPSIIHYKGESTRRESLGYVVHFYKAMLIYVRKHVHGIGGSVFRLMIMLGIIIRGTLGGLRRLLRYLFPVLMDAAILVGTLLLVKGYWARTYFHDANHFDARFYRLNLPLYALLFLTFLFLSGAHDPQRNARRILYGMTTGTIAILVVYAILPLQYRTSRAVILISALVGTCLIVLVTWLQHGLKRARERRNVAIVGSVAEVNRIMEILNRTEGKSILVGWIAVHETDSGAGLIGDITQLSEIVRRYGIRELVFSQDLSFDDINVWMSRLGPSIAYRISSAGSGEIVGSDSRKDKGTLYTARVGFALAYPMYRRQKRIADILVCLLLIPIAVVVAIFKRHTLLWRNISTVIGGRDTWVGYVPNDPQLSQLPPLRPGILIAGADPLPKPGEIHLINYIYAREYSVWKDFDVLLRNFNKIL